jgi:hypothetical protein
VERQNPVHDSVCGRAKRIPEVHVHITDSQGDLEHAKEAPSPPAGTLTRCLNDSAVHDAESSKHCGRYTQS